MIFCIDLDNDFNDCTQNERNNNIIKYTGKNEYKLIWFKRNIEEVFLGRSVPKSQKKNEANRFLRNTNFDIFDANYLKVKKRSISTPRICSNIVYILDKILVKKND